MANFWSKAMQVPQAPQSPGMYHPSPTYQQQYAPSPVNPQYPPQGYQQQAVAPENPFPQLPPNLAVQAGRQSAQDTQAGLVARQQGYINKPPSWVQNQATERCPECQGINFARSGGAEGTYGKKRRTTVGMVDYGHCFDCGFTLNGSVPLSDAQLGNAHNHMHTTGEVAATRQPHGMKNFFTIQGRIR